MGRDHVFAQVLVELHRRCANARPPGEVVHDLGAFERRPEIVLREVERLESEAAVRARLADVALLGDARVVVGEAVDADHLVAVAQDALDEVRADEAGRAGDDDFHGMVKCRRHLSFGW